MDPGLVHIKTLPISTDSLDFFVRCIERKKEHGSVREGERERKSMEYYVDIFIVSGELCESQLYQFSNDKFVESKYWKF